MRYTGRTVAITGASAGLGRAMALGFAADGARVAVIGTHAERTAAAAETIVFQGGEAAGFVVDISDRSAVESAFADITEELGDVAVLINNAAYAYGDILSLMNIDDAVLQRLIAVNVLGPLHCARAARAGLARSGAAAILNVSSVSAYLPSGGYALTKAALNSMTLSMAAELAAEGVRVNAIAPGRIESPNADSLVPQSVKDGFIKAQMVKRPGSERDVVEAALYLCSDAAGFITGQTLLLDGGYLAYAPKVATGAGGVD